jgi:hypothetical protein
MKHTTLHRQPDPSLHRQPGLEPGQGLINAAKPRPGYSLREFRDDDHRGPRP